MTLLSHSVPISSTTTRARLSTEVLIGLLVPPVLLGLLTARALATGLTQAGLASEQLFSGERLPNLNIPPNIPPVPPATPVA